MIMLWGSLKLEYSLFVEAFINLYKDLEYNYYVGETINIVLVNIDSSIGIPNHYIMWLIKILDNNYMVVL